MKHSCEDPLVCVTVPILESKTVMRTEMTDWNNLKLYALFPEQ